MDRHHLRRPPPTNQHPPPTQREAHWRLEQTCDGSGLGDAGAGAADATRASLEALAAAQRAASSAAAAANDFDDFDEPATVADGLGGTVAKRFSIWAPQDWAETGNVFAMPYLFLLLSAQLVARSLGRPMKDIVRLSTSKFGGAMATVPLGIFAGADSDGDGLANWKDSDVMDFDGCVRQPTALQTFCTATKKN